MFKASVLSVAVLAAVFCAAPATAQRAKISQGPTTSEIALELATARQQVADLQVDVGGLTGDLTTMTGRIETLEFQLAQAREEATAQDGDNRALTGEIKSLRSQLDAQNRAIAALDARLASLVNSGGVPTPSSSTSTYPGSTGSPAPTSGTVRTYSSPSAPVPTGATRTVTPAPTIITRTVTPNPPAPTSGGSLGTISASALPGEAGPLFATAKSRLIQFDYAGAEDAFRAFLEKFGGDPQAGEAHYWLGEALYQQKAYADSGVAYTTMIRSYPEDPRAPDALVKLARAMRLVGEPQKACLALDTLPKRYPTVSNVTRDLAAVERTKSGCAV
jgi:tol-pal system protein YbgF